MFGRIFGLKNLYKISRHVVVTQQFPITRLDRIVNTRLLHVKTYDKDAGHEIKRAANKFSNLEELESENNGSQKMYDLEEEVVGESLVNTKSNVEHVPLVDNVISDDPDIFGNASKENIPQDEGDVQEEEYISRPTRRSKQLSINEYANMIKDHLKNHRVNDALNVLEKRMLKEDRAKPDTYIYNLLISGCAKAGYSRKAFQLFTKMRQRGLKVRESTYTSLFNACANAPSREDGLTRAIRLRNALLDKGYEFNVKNYNAMIKTFGHWGDVKTAYILADEMRDKKLLVTGETFNFLLQACASDEKHGFRHCLLTWQKMLEKKIQPDYYTFNAVLRCVRDCGFGNINEMESVLQQILHKEPEKVIEAEKGNSDITSPVEDQKSPVGVALNFSDNDKALQLPNNDINLELPNLLAAKPHLGSMLSLAEVQKPHERFLLLGGLTGFLENMKSKSVTPDIQTFTTMLEVIPPTNAAEKQILMYIRKIGLKADIDFFNILIKKRAMRFDYEGGKEVLSMIRTAGLYPDIVTYGVLALGCTTVESSRELLEQMRVNGIRMNIQILGAMLRQGCSKKAFPYICEIMQISLEENIKPNEIFLRHLHNFYLHCARAIDSRYPPTKTKTFKKDHRKFCDKYRLYQEEHGIEGLKLEDAIKKVRESPYKQYQEADLIEGMEPLKNEKLARKNKIRKYIKKIKIQNFKDDEHTAIDTKLQHYSNSKNNIETVPTETIKLREPERDELTKKFTSKNPFAKPSL